MAKLSNFDFFVYGVVISITENTGIPKFVNLSDIAYCTDLYTKGKGLSHAELRVIDSMHKLKSHGLINFIFTEEKVLIDAGMVLDGMIEVDS